MSRFLSKSAVCVALVASAGCMHQPMYQQYPYGQPAPYGQPMYGVPGSAQPGTLVIPPSSGQPYTPGQGTYENDSVKGDDFSKDGTSPFYGNDDGGVPKPKDSTDPAREDFQRELGPTP